MTAPFSASPGLNKLYDIILKAKKTLYAGFITIINNVINNVFCFKQNTF